MKTLVLVFHPNMAASRVNRALAERAESLGDDVVVRRMYDLYPGFRIDIAAEQQAMEAADRIVLQFPILVLQPAPAQEVGRRRPDLRLGVRLHGQRSGRQRTPRRLLPRLQQIRTRKRLHLHGARVPATLPGQRKPLLPHLPETLPHYRGDGDLGRAPGEAGRGLRNHAQSQLSLHAE